MNVPGSKDYFNAALIYNFFKMGNLYKHLAFNNAILAGGAVRAMYDGTKVRDFDLYFPYIDNFSRIDMYFRSNCKTICTTDRAHTYQFNGHAVQLIKTNFADTMQPWSQNRLSRVADLHDYIDEYFDFSVCKGRFVFEYDEVMFPKGVKEDIEQRRLIISDTKFKGTDKTHTMYPLDTLVRVFKYMTYGYTIDKEQFDKIKAAIKLCAFSSNSSVSFYGEAVSAESVEKAKETSILNVCAELLNDRLEDLYNLLPDYDIKYYAAIDKIMEDIWKIFLLAQEEMKEIRSKHA